MAGRRTAVRSWPRAPAGSKSIRPAPLEMLVPVLGRDRCAIRRAAGRQGHSVPPAPAIGRRRTAAAGEHQHRGPVAGVCRGAGQGRPAVGPVHRRGQRLPVRDGKRRGEAQLRPAALRQPAAVPGQRARRVRRSPTPHRLPTVQNREPRRVAACRRAAANCRSNGSARTC